MEPLSLPLSPPIPFLSRTSEGTLRVCFQTAVQGAIIVSVSDGMVEVGNFTGKSNGLGENKRNGGGGQEKGKEILSFFLTPPSPD